MNPIFGVMWGVFAPHITPKIGDSSSLEINRLNKNIRFRNASRNEPVT
jgi:hypothetical protein